MKALMALVFLAAASSAQADVVVTYQCKGAAKAWFRRVMFDGQDQSGAGFSGTGYPEIENTELVILNASGSPEYIVRPAMSECSCLPGEDMYFTQFNSDGVRRWYALPGTFDFPLSDGSGTLTCTITLTGLTSKKK